MTVDMLCTMYSVTFLSSLQNTFLLFNLWVKEPMVLSGKFSFLFCQLLIILVANLVLHTFCSVCSCATNSETNEEVAIKKITNAFDNRVDAKRTLREIKLLCHMDHDNVISS